MAYGVNAPFGLRPIGTVNGGAWTQKYNEYYIYASDDGQTTYSTSIFTGDLVVWGTSKGATPAVNGKLNTIAIYKPNFTDGTPSTFPTTGAVPGLGVFLGCRYIAANNSTNVVVPSGYWPASTQVKPGTPIVAFICDDPNTVYEIQVSTHVNADNGAFVANPIFPNTNGTVTAGGFGSNFGINIGGGTNFDTVPIPNQPVGKFYANNPASGSTITMQSAMYLDVNTTTTAGTTHDYNKNVTTLPLRALGWSTNSANVPGAGLTMETTPFLNVRVTLNNPVYAIGSAATIVVA